MTATGTAATWIPAGRTRHQRQEDTVCEVCIVLLFNIVFTFYFVFTPTFRKGICQKNCEKVLNWDVYWTLRRIKNLKNI